MAVEDRGPAADSDRSLEDVLVLAQVDPQQGRARARTLLREAGDAETVTVAERALGLAAKELNDMQAATGHLERARDVALGAGLAVRAAQARMSLSLVLAYAGDTAEALRQADLAVPALRGQDGARLQMQRALILQRLGRLDEALDGYGRVLLVMRRLGDTDGEARLLANRGVLQAQRGQFMAADADLQEAAEIFERYGQRLHAAEARHNLGFVAGRRGDVPRALQMYDRAESEFQALGMRHGVPLLDRCETLLSVRLLPEARAAGEAAMADFEAAGMKADLAEAELLLAQVALLEGDARGAAALALRARRAFVRQRRWGWASLAQFAWVRGSWATDDAPTRKLLRAAQQVAAELASSGWVAPATEARVIAATIALALGLVGEAEEELRPLGKARRSGPVDARARAWHAEALLRHARGENRAADSALRAGFRLLARHQATLGATELRVHAGVRAGDLAGLGMRIAMDSGRADGVLGWSERWRAGSMR
ncbi:MAG: tetratricopeptide repeat protein, partial [Actinobacteria bacterium]|nr:tetratricopeptide repeat protein [Actinomycetota bacterium]